MSQAAEVAEVAPVVQMASPRDRPVHLLTAEYTMRRWHLVVAPHVALDSLLDPAFWAHVARRLSPGDRVHIDCEDRTWAATLFVRDTTGVSARMAVESLIDFDLARTAPALDAQSAERYRMQWVSPGAKYRIVRLSDGAEMTRGLDKAAAQQWISSRDIVDRR